MAKNAKFKFDDEEYHFEKDADVIKYGDKKLSTALNELAPVKSTGFGRQLLAADEADFRRLLEVGKEYFWDECQNRWTGTPKLSTAYKKFGESSAYLGSSGLYTNLVIGGNPFTISFWMRPSSNTGTFFRAIGAAQSFGFTLNDKGYGGIYYGTTSASTVAGGGMISPPSTGTWHHVEFTYTGGTLRLFIGGTLKHTFGYTVSRENRRIQFPSFSGYVDEFRIIDGRCLHTAAFTPPTSAYTRVGDTVSLLHFE